MGCGLAVCASFHNSWKPTKPSQTRPALNSRLSSSSLHLNYLKIGFSPFIGIDVISEYWLPDGQTAAGRIWVKNASELDRKLRLELTAILNPAPEGRPLTPRVRESTTVLQGLTENLQPILFITGGAIGEASPYPNLYHDLALAPGSHRRFTWVLASLEDDEESFRHARLTAAQNWDAEISRIAMLAAQGCPHLHRRSRLGCCPGPGSKDRQWPALHP